MAIKIAGTEVINDNKELVLAKLTEIDASIADTAVDVFVYDTSQDSDGGAWRHRTQHTSWYNETLNTATRGSRKEFPAVAVIVAETNQVTIYDGDDPDLPMWMVFNQGSGQHLGATSLTLTALVATNGGIYVTYTSGSYGYHQLNFLKDASFFHNSNGVAVRSLPILNRNEQNSSTVINTNGVLNAAHNDVAMTVLPNAPIDAATGLPVPTIAVGTDGGVSVITDSGAVYDSDYTSGIKDVAFDAENTLFYMRNASTYSLGMALVADYTAGDGFGDLVASANASLYDFALLGTRQQVTIAFQDGIVTTGGFTSGDRVLGIHKINKSNPVDVLSAGITSSYNTGWMNGDIKLATLSDTDDTDVTGSELVTNGTFDSNASWNFSAGWGVSGGELVATSAGVNTVTYQNIPTTTGKTYVATIDCTGITAGSFAMYYRVDGGNYQNNVTLTAGETASLTFTALSSSSRLVIYALSDSSSGTFDNATLRLAEPDRSVNGNGLQVFGTVTKTPVATGADLVAYSGFDASNYLEQPYNSDLDFGTGDFCVMGWFKGTDTDGILIMRDSATTAENFYIRLLSGEVQCRIDDGTTSKVFTGGSGLNSGTWNFVTLVKSGNNGLVYVNGFLKHTQDISAVGNLDNANAVLTIGNNTGLTNAWGGSLALLRISATAPSPEQIKKIYEDEKVLFQENAQATLYGTSDAVTALAHDPVTDLLHVGTSDGRSDFQGLRRVSNTTTGVTTAISASNGLILEQ